MGYAAKCVRLPLNRQFDAVRFSVASDQNQRLLVSCVGESAHLPVEHRQLEFDVLQMQWITPHPDPRMQKMAECYVEAYLQRRTSNVNS